MLSGAVVVWDATAWSDYSRTTSLLASPPLTRTLPGFARENPLRTELSTAVVFSPPPPTTQSKGEGFIRLTRQYPKQVGMPERCSDAGCHTLPENAHRPLRPCLLVPPGFAKAPGLMQLASPHCERQLFWRFHGVSVEALISGRSHHSHRGERHSRCQVLLRQSVEAYGQATHKKLLGANTPGHQYPQTLA